MTSRERILAALERRRPDRVPIDLGGNQSGIHVKAYERLLAHLGITEESTVISSFTQQLARPCGILLERFHVDTRWIRPLSNYMPYDHMAVQHEKGYVGVHDAFGVFWGNDARKDLHDILYYDPVIHPLEQAATVQDVENHAWPDGKDAAPFKGLADQARQLHEKTDFAVISTAVGNTFELCTFLFGLTRAMKLVRTKPELLDAAMKRLVEYWKDYNTTYLGLVGKYLDAVCINGDLAGQDGPLFNPAFYEKHVKPMDKEIAMHVKKCAPHIKINYHSCGSVPQFLPHFADLGYDSANPVQVSARDMEPCSLVRRFGDLISFWGGLCSPQSTLPFGTPTSVKAEVKRNVECFKSGSGGYIAANVHNITAEVPAKNIVAMLDTAYEFGTY
jgi:uroporphyrinogen decarboxylase